jgi:WhiB family transcriptional regulator, redox-sensing transcriptional regulator
MAAAAALPLLVAAQWEWRIRGACRGFSPDLFFNADSERGRPKRIREARARAICTTCPVIVTCLDWALSVGEPYGIWAGTSPAERRQITSENAHSTAHGHHRGTAK